MNKQQSAIITNLLTCAEQVGKIKNVIINNTKIFLDFDSYGALEEANGQLLLDAISEGLDFTVLSQEALYGAKAAFGIEIS